MEKQRDQELSQKRTDAGCLSVLKSLKNHWDYLCYKPLPGAQLRYLVCFRNEELACLDFGASAWEITPRDQFIGRTHEQSKSRLHFVINNARLLILPWVQSRNLASKILSLVARRILKDCQNRYGYQPVLMETFVECKIL